MKIAAIDSLARVSAWAVGAASAVALSLTPHLAMSATITYSNPNCTSFSISGPAGAQAVSCLSGSGSVSAPVCTPSANPSAPPAAASTTITANCTNQPATYVWTGTGCAGLTTASCVVSKPSPGTRTFTVQAINAAGTSALTQITVNWR